MAYILSPQLSAFSRVLKSRMEAGFGGCLMLTGPAGGGKTSFAYHLAAELGGGLHYYSGSPDRERDLLYEIDVGGVVRRENAWIPGPAWEAFTATALGRYAVLLVDEADKTAQGFDAFLLRLLEEWSFRSPNGDTIAADPKRLAVILTSNGRREFRPEVLRRCQRINVPWPDDARLVAVCKSIAGTTLLPSSILNLVIRIGNAVRKKEEEKGPSPKEITLCTIDMMSLAAAGEIDMEVWRAVAASWLTKDGEGARHIDKACEQFKWGVALKTESLRAPRLVA